MNAELERFRNAVRDSEELRRGVASARNPDELAAMAQANGYQFSAADLNSWSEQLPQGELADGDLDAVAGGIGTQTAGGGNTSVWGKIKSVWFGVDASFYD